MLVVIVVLMYNVLSFLKRAENIISSVEKQQIKIEECLNKTISVVDDIQSVTGKTVETKNNIKDLINNIKNK